LSSLRVADFMTTPSSYATFDLDTPAPAMSLALTNHREQITFPVVDASGAIVGVVGAPAISFVAAESDLHSLTVAADLMHAVASVSPSDHLDKVAELLVGTDQRELLVLAPDGRIAGFIHESIVTRAHLAALAHPPPRSGSGGD